ncbi:MucR family transcriptional regulator [Aminobacter aganoensis]|uniref:Putative transcriptional regulator n=1 Tax=Aminobacter aganoensis TaxID=83264 RepID=A0A7X0KNI8_9HYPH|nr:MucR family transcriptional regulator [Aminobacter aganoensis]MBB6357210.1 putative transcriptional regulator [Aminobacter aganoensis]
MTDEATRNDSSGAVALASDIVVAYVSNNSVPRAELPALIADIHAAIQRLRTGATPVPDETRSPAVPIKKSVTADYIVCLEDGKKFKSLKRHLSTHYNLSPDEYRQKWSLPLDYPMVAPAYAAARSSLAKSMGLGRKRAAQAPAPVVAEKPKRPPASRAAAPAAKARTAKSAAKPTRRKKADA